MAISQCSTARASIYVYIHQNLELNVALHQTSRIKVAGIFYGTRPLSIQRLVEPIM